MARNKKSDDIVEVVENSKSGPVKVITTIAIFSLIIYSIFNIISQQAQIAQLKKQSDELTTKITEAKQQNDEYIRLLSADDEAEYMERIAIERLGYAYPNERRFYVVEGK